ncbi:Transcriptional regulator, TetR family protein [Minicystis rosea]|nr:Transcriptional regulator, TetR family protein [Minicystis rosea]
MAEIAGVSVGSLYQYFPHRDAIVRLLIDAHVRSMLVRVDEALCQACSAATSEEVVRRFVGELVAAHAADLERWGLIAAQVLRFGDLDAGEEVWRAVIDRAHGLVRRIAPDLPEAECARAAERLTFLVRALLVDTLAQRPEELRDGRLAEDISCLILGYVGRCSARGSAPAPSALTPPCLPRGSVDHRVEQHLRERHVLELAHQDGVADVELRPQPDRATSTTPSCLDLTRPFTEIM